MAMSFLFFLLESIYLAGVVVQLFKNYYVLDLVVLNNTCLIGIPEMYSSKMMFEHVSMYLRQSLIVSENLDIASFRGLPVYPAFKRNVDDHHSLSSSPSGSMSPEPDQLSDREEKSQVPCVTSVSVGTKPVDIRPSAYVGFPEGTVHVK